MVSRPNCNRRFRAQEWRTSRLKARGIRDPALTLTAFVLPRTRSPERWRESLMEQLVSNEVADDANQSGCYDILNQLPTSIVPVVSLLSADSPRRAGTNLAHARLLAEIPSDQLPPILVHKQTMRVIDGMHRLEAARLRSDDMIAARIVDASEEEAFLLAIKINTLHGMPLSRADRKAAADRILANHPDWSDRAVAAAVGMGAKTVASIRRRSTAHAPQLNGRVGRDGKRRPMDGAEGRRRAGKLIAARPTASLREIAKEASISLGTARDVRERMRQGSDPVPPRQHRGRGGSLRPILPLDTFADGEAEVGAWLLARTKLSKDPALKYTDSGRALLVWLERHKIDPEERRAFVDSVPPHWLRGVAQLARSWSEEWRQFALQLEQRG